MAIAGIINSNIDRMKTMLDYKVIQPKVKELEDAVNEAAREGGRQTMLGFAE